MVRIPTLAEGAGFFGFASGGALLAGGLFYIDAVDHPLRIVIVVGSGLLLLLSGVYLVSLYEYREWISSAE